MHTTPKENKTDSIRKSALPIITVPLKLAKRTSSWGSIKQTKALERVEGSTNPYSSTDVEPTQLTLLISCWCCWGVEGGREGLVDFLF